MKWKDGKNKMLDNDLKTSLIFGDAATEDKPWSNENNRKWAWYLK